MKRYSIALCIVLACTALFAAQSMAQMQFGVGPIVGVNFGTVSISPSPTYPAGYSQGGHTGIIFGAQAELGFAKMFYIEMEPSYIGKGFSISTPAGTATVTANELQIPVLFKVKFMPGVIRPYAFAGPNIGFVLTSTETSPSGQDTDLKSETSSTDFAIDFGGGAEYNVTPKIGITLDIRYSLGLGNLNSVAGSTTTWHASGFQILAGVMFHII